MVGERAPPELPDDDLAARPRQPQADVADGEKATEAVPERRAVDGELLRHPGPGRVRVRALEDDREVGGPRATLAAQVVEQQVGGAVEQLGDLPAFFIVSQVELATARDGDGNTAQSSDLGVCVEPARGAKCGRCWNYSEVVGTDGEHPQLCERCLPVVRALNTGAQVSA